MAVSRLDGRGISLFPARAARHTRSITCISHLARFECAVTRIQSRTRFLGSSRFARALPLESLRPWVRCIAESEVSLLSMRHITCGDVNPDCSRLGRFSRPLVSGGLIAGRRLPPCPQLIASHGLLLLGSRSPYVGSLFRFRRSLVRRRKLPEGLQAIDRVLKNPLRSCSLFVTNCGDVT
jgi:hypothetical protein